MPPTSLGDFQRRYPDEAACAAWLLGAWAAAETIIRCAALGTPAELDERFVLRTQGEVV